MNRKLLIIVAALALIFVIIAIIQFIPGIAPIKHTIIKTKIVLSDDSPASDGRIYAQFNNSLGDIMVNVQVPNQPTTMPIYSGKYLTNGKVHVSRDWHDLTKQTACPSMQAAPELAKKALEPYGGLPPDAVMEKAPGCAMYNFTSARYNRSINGIPVFDDIIWLDFDQEGNVSWLLKEWRTYEYQETVPIINVRTAVEKLKDGRVLNPLQCSCAGNFDKVQLEYFNGYRDRNEVTLEPVWVFSGTSDHGNGLSFIIGARESNSTLDWADFSANATHGIAPFTVAFSDASRYHEGMNWSGSYDFGDGNFSYDKNTIHTYLTPGNYTVSLYGYDGERGSDQVKRNFITVTES
jgi:hypothetical protein